jgi:hypothetical protein
MRRVVILAVLPLIAIVALLGWNAGDDDAVAPARAAAKPGKATSTNRMADFAYRQVERQAKKTCRSVPRDVLAEAFAAASDDPGLAGVDPAEADDNYVALWYAEDVGLSPVPLQRAAYDGCMAGLRAHR